MFLVDKEMESICMKKLWFPVCWCMVQHGCSMTWFFILLAKLGLTVVAVSLVFWFCLCTFHIVVFCVCRPAAAAAAATATVQDELLPRRPRAWPSPSRIRRCRCWQTGPVRGLPLCSHPLSLCHSSAGPTSGHADLRQAAVRHCLSALPLHLHPACGCSILCLCRCRLPCHSRRAAVSADDILHVSAVGLPRGPVPGRRGRAGGHAGAHIGGGSGLRRQPPLRYKLVHGPTWGSGPG